MASIVVQFEHTDKHFGSFQALTNINLSLESGKIYGLIGKNGAGKTTLMRILTGLSFPSGGKLSLFGKTAVDAEKKGAANMEGLSELKRVGSLIESPSLNASMTAKENMKFFCLLKGVPYDSSADQLLNEVGLDDTGKKKVKDFSLGMRQRLGIAVALIGNPELLVLDEPVNGLDPIGVIEIRNLIKKLNEERKLTFLISSHNLPELFRTASNYLIIDKGRLLQEITLQELEEKGEDSLEEYFISVITGSKSEPQNGGAI